MSSRIRQDFDVPTNHLIGAHSYCTQVRGSRWPPPTPRPLPFLLCPARPPSGSPAAPARGGCWLRLGPQGQLGRCPPWPPHLTRQCLSSSPALCIVTEGPLAASSGDGDTEPTRLSLILPVMVSPRERPVQEPVSKHQGWGLRATPGFCLCLSLHSQASQSGQGVAIKSDPPM